MKKVILLSVVLSSLLTACASNDDRSAGMRIDDAGITSGINAQYVLADDVKARHINVDTYKGVVTLSGTVLDRSTEERAVTLATNIKGVKKVINNLKVEE